MEQNNKDSIESEGTPEAILSQEEIDAQNKQHKRIAKRILNVIIKSIPSLVPALKEKSEAIMVNNEVKMPLLDEYSGCILPSYIIVKGDKQRTLYFCIMKDYLYEMIKDILKNDRELREALTKHTVKIQFACPDLGFGLYFKKKSEGFLKGKKTHIYQFSLKKEEAS